jgi:enoyl-CoA hydratase/carnithine racemase
MANLVRPIGRKAAFELVSLGEPIGAARARELGMANRIVPEAEVEAEAARLARALAAHDAAAMALTKALFHRVADLPLKEALEAGRDANIAMRRLRSRSEAEPR